MSKSKKKSKRHDYDEDYVEREVAKAMKQMEKAMKEVKMAEKEARKARKTSSRVFVSGEPDDQSSSGMKIFLKTETFPGTYIHVESAENVQVGSNNVMHVQNNRKGRKSSRNDSSSDSELEGLASIPKERVVPIQDRDPKTLTDAEKRIYDVLHSEREVTFVDIDICCEHVGSWRRFLRYFGLEDSLLEQLYQDNVAAGVREIISQGLQIWHQRAAKKATVGTLARTLQRVEYEDAINYLRP